MVRTFLYLIASVFAIAFMRGVIGIIGKGVSQLFEEESAASGRKPASGGSSKTASRDGGELVKCPSCGTYFPGAKAVKKSLQGQSLSFCSEDCRAKLA